MPAEPSGAERRKFPRLRESCSIRVKPIAGAQFASENQDAIAVNISGGGLCYRARDAVTAGDFLAVEMALPEFSSPIVAMGRAVFCEPAAEGYEVGIEFWWVGWGDDSAQRAISDYIKTELRRREPPRS
jgi:hypothetical protein